MDQENELARAKWLLGSILLFLVSCFICYSEVMYLLLGKQIQASIANVYPTGRSKDRLAVSYEFTEPDGTRCPFHKFV